MSIHPTALIDPKAEVHESVEVGPFCVIEANVRVGAGCRLCKGVYLTGWTDIGEDCELHPGVVVGHAPQDTKYQGQRTHCRIGRGTVLREYVTIHRGTIPDSETVVGAECFLLAGAHVGHNCVVGDHVTLINNVLLAGHVFVGDRATIGGGAAIHQFARIGTLTMISGGARVSMDVVPYALCDADGRVAGINRVGLRRAGLSLEQVAEIRAAYRTLFNQTGSFGQAVARLTEHVTDGPAMELVRFLAEESHRGIAGRTRRTSESRKSASTPK